MQVEELDRLCIELCEIEDECSEVEEKLKELKEKYRMKQTEVINVLEKNDKVENSGSFGKVKITQREYYKMKDKEAVMEWLKARGDYDSLVSVNANTFSSYAKQLIAEKREEGDYVWLPPGVEDSTSDYKYLKITRSRL